MKTPTLVLSGVVFATSLLLHGEDRVYDPVVTLTRETVLASHGISMHYFPPNLVIEMPRLIDNAPCSWAHWFLFAPGQYIEIPVDRQVREEKLRIIISADRATLAASHLRVVYEPTSSNHVISFEFDFRSLLKDRE